MTPTIPLADSMWWIVLPIGAIVLGALLSARSPRWLRSLLLFSASIAVSIVLLSSLTTTLHMRRISDEQSRSPVKIETYVEHVGHAR